jgi:VanZ family protein
MSPRSHATRRRTLRIVFVVVLAILLYAGLRPEHIPEFFNEEDKLHHLAGFAALALSTRMAFPRGSVLWQIAGMVLLGVFIELAQELLPDRTSSIWDILANLTGIAVGLALARLPFLRRYAAAPDRP